MRSRRQDPDAARPSPAEREPYSRLALPVLIATPVIALALLAALGLTRVGFDSLAQLVPHKSPPATRPQRQAKPAPHVSVHQSAEGKRRGDLENITVGQAAALAKGKEIFLFGTNLHSVPLADSAASTDATVTHAAESTQSMDAVFLRVDEPTTTSPLGVRNEWWYPQHWEQVKRAGASSCFECHEETNCSDCHVAVAGVR